MRLRGKGRKQRTCPLWQRTVTAVQAWLHLRAGSDRNCSSSMHWRPAIHTFGRRLHPATSQVAGIPRAAARRATVRRAPHHRDAPPALRVDITTIAAWLGHADLSMTHAYVQIDLPDEAAGARHPRRSSQSAKRESPLDALINWLERIGATAGLCARQSPCPVPSRLTPTPPT